MPYATENKLTTSPQPNSIEISDDQYLEVIEHITNGNHYFIEQGNLVLTTVPERKPGHLPPQRVNGEWVHELEPEKEEGVQPPQPNWDQFNFQMFSDPAFNQATSEASSLVVSGLITGLAQVSSGQLSSFQMMYGALLQQAAVTQESRTTWLGYAEQANLPEEFKSIL